MKGLIKEATVFDLTLDPQSEADMKWAFPKVDPGIEPCGERVMFQVRTPKVTTRGGIILTNETSETDLWNTQVGKLIAVGPLAFKNRMTLGPWVEGEWAKIGDYCRIPIYGGDKWKRPVPGRTREKDGMGSEALFMIIKDTEIIGKITCSPLEIKAYI